MEAGTGKYIKWEREGERERKSQIVQRNPKLLQYNQASSVVTIFQTHNYVVEDNLSLPLFQESSGKFAACFPETTPLHIYFLLR